MKNAIMLNKQFSGEWLNYDNNIAHEITNFHLTDLGEHYVYNLPHTYVNFNVFLLSFIIFGFIVFIIIIYNRFTNYSSNFCFCFIFINSR